MNQRILRSSECFLLFVLLPVVPLFVPIKGALFVTLWVLALLALLWWKRKTKERLRPLFAFRSIPKDELRYVLKRFALIAPLMLAFIYWYDQERFFELPLERTPLWLIIMVFYPLISVFPQEVIFRLFFFERYKMLFSGKYSMVLVSGFLFGWAHLLFQNWIAVSMCIAGGIMFSSTWKRSKSFPLIWVEHALYGCWVFTIGLGWYFYSGAVR